MAINRFNKDRYKLLLWDIIESLFWLNTYHQDDMPKTVYKLAERYINELKDVIKDIEKENGKLSNQKT